MQLAALRKALGKRKLVMVRELAVLFPITTDAGSHCLCIAGIQLDQSSGTEILSASVVFCPATGGGLGLMGFARGGCVRGR